MQTLVDEVVLEIIPSVETERVNQPPYYDLSVYHGVTLLGYYKQITNDRKMLDSFVDCCAKGHVGLEHWFYVLEDFIQGLHMID